MKKVLLGASYSVIEPLGLLHLAGLARDLGWDRKIILIKDCDYTEFYKIVDEYQPDVVGFNAYTGNHTHIFEALRNIKHVYPGMVTVVGGPHPTYFPSDSLSSSDYVVMSEGFGAFGRILNGTAQPGILPMTGIEKFPLPDRETFYRDYPAHANSKIKSIISMTGCPYTCSYCYNSSSPEDIKDNLPPEIADEIGKTMGMGGRLFPHNVRSVDDVITEAKSLKDNWPTSLIYFQDDVYGFDKTWLRAFADRWPTEVGLPFHAQMRWEMTNNDERLDLLVEAGCSGLTLAIESANPQIRSEVLNRPMRNRLVFDGMKSVVSRGLKVRTEQITGLPYGATSIKTPVNLDADLSLIELNVALKEATGGPTMAWASTLVPYAGTKLGEYCTKFGHFDLARNNEIKDTFFERSIMRFPTRWYGLELENLKEDNTVWLSEKELERYRDQNAELRNLFNFFTLIPKGHVLARSYLSRDLPFSFERLGQETIAHLTSINETKILNEIDNLLAIVPALGLAPGETATVVSLLPYFASLPKGDLALKRFVKYGQEQGSLSHTVLSTATRHHLYDEILYSEEELLETVPTAQITIPQIFQDEEPVVKFQQYRKKIA